MAKMGGLCAERLEKERGGRNNFILQFYTYLGFYLRGTVRGLADT